MLVSPVSLDITYETNSKIKLRVSEQQPQSVQVLLSMATLVTWPVQEAPPIGGAIIAPTITGGCDGALDLWILMLLRPCNQ